jgi:hypothetical protein
MAADIEHSASVGHKTAGEHHTAAKGLEERWLKALEQAHLEKQVAAMRRPGGPHDAAMGGASGCRGTDAAGRLPTSGAEPVSGRPPAVSPEAESSGLSLCTGRPAADAADAGGILCEPARDAALRLYPAAADSSPLSERSDAHDNRARVQGPRPVDLFAVRRRLPPSSMLTAIDGEDGVQLVIRDASVEPADVLRTIENIRQVLGLRKRRLGSVTLNGVCLWENGAAVHGDGRDRDAIPAHWIDRIF